MHKSYKYSSEDVVDFEYLYDNLLCLISKQNAEQDKKEMKIEKEIKKFIEFFFTIYVDIVTKNVINRNWSICHITEKGKTLKIKDG